LQIITKQEIPEDPALRQAWNALVLEMEDPQIFYTYDWAMAVQRAFQETEVLLMLVYEQEALRGVAVLALNSKSKIGSFLCGTTADYCDFVSRPADRDNFVALLLAEVRRTGIKKLVLPNLPSDSSTVDTLVGAAKNEKFKVFQRLGYHCSRTVLGQAPERAEQAHEIDKKKMFRRNINFLRRDAPVILDHVRDWPAAETLLPEFAEAHVARFLATGRISNLVRIERRRFLTELARHLGASGWLTITRLMRGSEAVAWNYGFQYSGSWFWYQPTFDSRFEEHSPGYCLLAKMIIEACGDPRVNLIDLGLGAEDYKDRFANGSRETLHITLNASRVRHTTTALRYYMAETVKKFPRLENWARAFRSCAYSLREHFRVGLIALVKWAAARVTRLVFSRDQVEFFEWEHSSAAEDGFTEDLKEMSLEILARGAILYHGDEQTLAYLLRAARRLRTDPTAAGFALMDRKGAPLHFCWSTDFHGFFMSELGLRLSSASSQALIFDCWTPVPARGQGFYAKAIAALARRLESAGKQTWIFSAQQNPSSLRGIAKAGFTHRYSMSCRKMLGWHRISKNDVRVSEQRAVVRREEPAQS
jgi:CelD/BcsL family acetyltransferase involved in cellulose biosynthesis